MSDRFSARFPHRHNTDGSFDSICPGCFQTIDRRRLESDLSAIELTHTCYPLGLLRDASLNQLAPIIAAARFPLAEEIA